MLGIYSGCIVVIMFAIYYGNEKRKYSEEGVGAMFMIKSALKSEQHFEYAKKSAIQLGAKVIGFTVIMALMINYLYASSIMSSSVYAIVSIIVEIAPVITYILIFDQKVKNFELV